MNPQLVATAGRCTLPDDDWPEPIKWNCESSRFVFDFRCADSQDQPQDIEADQIYSCNPILAYDYVKGTTRPDFALIELDRPVTKVEFKRI